MASLARMLEHVGLGHSREATLLLELQTTSQDEVVSRNAELHRAMPCYTMEQLSAVSCCLISRHTLLKCSRSQFDISESCALKTRLHIKVRLHGLQAIST
jgi:hypothetical protein